MTQPQLSRIERDQAKPTVELISEIVSALGETPKSLCEGTDAVDLAATVDGVSREAYDEVVAEMLVVRLDLEKERNLAGRLRQELEQAQATRERLREQLRLARIAEQDARSQFEQLGEHLQAEVNRRQCAELQSNVARYQISRLQQTLQEQKRLVGSAAVAAGGFGALVGLLLGTLDEST